MGSAPELGGWDACKGVKLERHGDVWRATTYIYNVWNSVCLTRIINARKAAFTMVDSESKKGIASAIAVM